MKDLEPPCILLIGRNGQVGWELQRTLAPLGRLVCVDYPELDLADGRAIRQCVHSVAPALVVNAAAYTAVDRAEAEPDLAMAINGVAPGILAEEASRLGALLVHYSTDYVFDGTRAEAYREDDPPNPLNAYGRSKLAGERAVQQVGADHLIFRLCWVYGARGQNFLRTILRLARDRETLRVVLDQRGSPTWSRMIAEATALALQRSWIPGETVRCTGLYHLSAAGQTTWHGFAGQIVALMPSEGRQCHQVEPITAAEYPTAARRPANSVLSCEKLKRTFGLQLPDWQESLQQVLEPS